MRFSAIASPRSQTIVLGFSKDEEGPRSVGVLSHASKDLSLKGILIQPLDAKRHPFLPKGLGHVATWSGGEDRGTRKDEDLHTMAL